MPCTENFGPTCAVSLKPGGRMYSFGIANRSSFTDPPTMWLARLPKQVFRSLNEWDYVGIKARLGCLSARKFTTYVADKTDTFGARLLFPDSGDVVMGGAR